MSPAIGTYQHLVTLDTRDGDPLDPPSWYCGYSGGVAGIATLIGPYHPGISCATRVHFRDRLFHVIGILNRDERDRELVLTCAEVFD